MEFYWGIMVGIAAILILRLFFSLRKKVVKEFYVALMYRRGRIVGVLPPGQYIILRSSTTLDIWDTRPRWLTVPGQEILSLDKLSVKVSMVCKYRVADAHKAAASGDFNDELYNVLQLILRERVSQLTLEEILLARKGLSDGLATEVSQKLDGLGLEILDVQVKDIMLANDLKKTYAEVAKARQQGLATLENARAETASLRNLANAAKMLEDNPMLFKLRLLQSAADNGNSIVINTDTDK